MIYRIKWDINRQAEICLCGFSIYPVLREVQIHFFYSAHCIPCKLLHLHSITRILAYISMKSV